MKRILTTAAMFSLLSLSGCNHIPVFEGTLFTYTLYDVPHYDPGPTVVSGGGHNLSHRLDPSFIFASEEFWRNYAQDNPDLREEEIISIREGFSILAIKTSRQDKHLVAQWRVRIKDGNQETFESLCFTYRRTHHWRHAQVHSGSTMAIKFLEARREELLRSYLDEKSAHEESPTNQSKEQVDIARRNLEQIESRLKEAQVPRPIHGQIVRELMDLGISSLSEDN